MLSSHLRLWVFLMLGTGVFLLSALARKTNHDKEFPNETIISKCIEAVSIPEETQVSNEVENIFITTDSAVLEAEGWHRKENISITY